MTSPSAVVVGAAGSVASSPFPARAARVGDVEIAVSVSDLGSGQVVAWSVRNPGRSTVTVDRVGLRYPWTPDRVLEHGYQSWSIVRRCSPADVRPQRAAQPAWVRGLYLADPSRAGAVVAGDQFLVTDRGVAGFVGGRHHLSTVEAAAGGGDGVTAWALLDGVELGPGEERRLDAVWAAEGDPGALYSELADHWGAAVGGRCDAPAPVGWCSWYQYFADITPADIRRNLALAVEHGIELVQVDDGYQAEIGRWLDTRPSWAEGTAAVARSIRAAGAEAGIWTAPFLAAEGGALVTEHPDWVVRDERDRPLRAMWNPVWWGGWSVALDTTHPAVLDHLTGTFAALSAQGFSYHKIDFCYAAALPGRRHDPSRTRGQALRAGLEAVRRGVGGDAFLLGCGCPLGQAAGLVDAMRVSEDVAPLWDPELTVPGFEESATSARNAIATSVLRAPLHRRLWINDPDCVLLRPTLTGLEPWQRRMLAVAVAGAGAFVVLSDDLGLYGDDEWALVSELRALRAPADAPLDLADPFADALTVRSEALALEIDWRDGAPPLPPPAGTVLLEAAGPEGPAARLSRG